LLVITLKEKFKATRLKALKIDESLARIQADSKDEVRLNTRASGDEASSITKDQRKLVNEVSSPSITEVLHGKVHKSNSF